MHIINTEEKNTNRKSYTQGKKYTIYKIQAGIQSYQSSVGLEVVDESNNVNLY